MPELLYEVILGLISIAAGVIACVVTNIILIWWRIRKLKLKALRQMDEEERRHHVV
jgi:hypothetical protein